MMPRRISRAFAALALAVALAPAAQATTYYVATNGSDSNPGTAAAPFATIQGGVNHAGPGDTILVNDGTYGCPGGQDSMGVTINSAGTSSAWITLQAAHPHAAILDGQLICHSYIALGGSAAYWIIRGFDIRNGRWAGIWSNSGGGKNMLIQNNWIHSIGNRYETASTGIVGIYADNGATNFKIDGNTFYSVGRTAVLTGTHDHSIYTHGASMIITNNIFYAIMNGWHIQTAVGFGGIIANNTFYGPDPVAGTVGQVMLWDVDTNVTIRNNIFYNPTSIAVTTYALSITGSCSVDHNIVYNTGGSVGMFASLPAGCSESNDKVNVDPKLVNPSGYNFQLTSGSPAIDAGTTVSGVTTDFAGIGRPQGAAFDIGAYEYAVSGSPSGGGGGTPAPAPGGGGGGAVTPAPSGRVSIVPIRTPTTVVSKPASVAATGLGTASVPGGSAAAPACVTNAATWQNIPFTAQGGRFTIRFDAKPSAAAMDGVIGVSNGVATSYASLAASVRFNEAGRIDARNGAAYAAATAIPYSPGVVYRFRIIVNVPAHAFSAYVTAGSGAEQTIGTGYAFRTEQGTVGSVSSVGMFASKGSQTVCGIAAGAQ